MSDVVAPTARACTADDVQAVLALVRADEERVSGRPSRLVEGDVRDWWQTVDLAAESWLLEAPGSQQAIGVTWLDRPPAADVGIAFPIAAELEALPVLVDLAERRATELALPRLQLGVLLPDPPAEALLADRGYREVRRFFDMAIEFDGPPAAAVVPAGFTLRTATVADGPDFHATIDESFRDHWEFHPRPFDEWWQLRTSDPDFDISWWFLMWEGDRAVAAIRNVPARNGGVYVATLGVRRDRSGRGLAKALLAHTFARAWEAGYPRVTLGVDATSPTGATALYRAMGMTTQLESAVWEKGLTPAGAGSAAGGAP